MRDIDKWKIKYLSIVLGQVLSLVPGLEPRKIVKRALDGSIYVQTIGRPGAKVIVSGLCTYSEYEELIKYAANASLLTIQYKDKIYYGYIEEMPDYEETVDKGGHYTVSFEMWVEGSTQVNEVT